MQHSSPEAAREALKKAGKENASLETLIKEGYIMSVDQWLLRILCTSFHPPSSCSLFVLTISSPVLESIAGVPGFVRPVISDVHSHA
jgi:hypothetical protein